MTNITESFEQDLEKGAVSYRENVSDEEMEKIRPRDTNKSVVSYDGETVYLGGMAFDRSELAKVLGASSPPLGGVTSQVVEIRQTNFRPLGNPVPLGLCGYAISTFCLSMTLLEAGGATNPKLLIGSSLTLSGIGTGLCGIWCLLNNDTFSATALAAFGGFYMSYGIILIDAFGIASSYATTEEFNTVMGFWLVGWTLYAFLMWLLTLKGGLEFSVLIGLIVLYLLVLTAFYFTGVSGLKTAAGVFSCLSSIVAFYLIWSIQATEELSHIVPPVLMCPGRNRKAKKF